jgi:hypothetical protein
MHMLTLPGNRQRFCDGMPRRTVLRTGVSLAGTLGLAPPASTAVPRTVPTPKVAVPGVTKFV